MSGIIFAIRANILTKYSRDLSYMKRIITIAFLLIGFVAHSSDAQKSLRTVNNQAFKPGEKLKFRLHYGIISAGEAILEVKSDLNTVGGRDCYHVVGTGESVGAFNWFFKVRDRYESVIDKNSIVPWMFIRRVDEGGFIINENVTFNHYKNTAASNGTRNKKPIDRNIDSLPEGIQDMVSAFYYARTIDFSNVKEGDIFPIQGLIDNEVVPLNIKFIGRDEVDTKKGTFRCLKFRPMLQQGRVFKDNEDMTVWVSDDKNHLPIRVQTEVLVGSIKMDLVDFENLANEPAIVKD
jgi:hypothetical protein